ncbi:kinase [Anoxybacterium hadale]|uniref:Kinase n=1 Tax=Anoxybacterium hadale TaxID=3408580 RepID=A0ACD1AC16_9FIRM|nr:kinase [Clostridiales bacterium]
MSEVSIIGGITADIEGHPHNRLIYGDSNPGKIAISYGGVGRNIVENLARLGTKADFISVAGDDLPGRGAVRELQDLGVGVEHVRLLPEENTAVYMSILNLVGDMELAMCNMDVLERISIAFLEETSEHLKKAKVVGIDTNLTEDTLEYVTRQLKDTPIFLDPVSVAKAERARGVIGRFHTVKPNRMEAETISGLSILSEQDLKEAARWFIGQGVQRVFITLGGGGVFYMDDKDEGLIRPEPIEIASTTGAGDAFSAAVIYGILKEFGIGKTARLGMAAAAIAMEAKSAVNNQMSMDRLRQKLNGEVL